MTTQRPEAHGLVELPKMISLIFLAGISGLVVWSFHRFEWPEFLACLVAGGFSGIIAGGLVGVRVLPTLLTMGAMGGLLEGVFQSWQVYRSVGVILGGLVGAIIGIAAVMLPVMFIHLVMVLRGIDPIAGSDTPEKRNETRVDRANEGPHGP